MKHLIVCVCLLLFPSLCQGFDVSFDQSYIEAKYYNSHNEYTPQPGSGVGVDRWAIELNMEAEFFSKKRFRLFAGVNPEWHYMVDFPEDIERRFAGDLRAVTVRYSGGIRWDDVELRYFHQHEDWKTGDWSRYLFSGVAFRWYFGR